MTISLFQMSDVMDQFHTVGASLANKLSSSCKKDYEKLGQAAAAMAEATTFDSSNGNQKLLQALRVRSFSEPITSSSIHGPKRSEDFENISF